MPKHKIDKDRRNSDRLVCQRAWEAFKRERNLMEEIPNCVFELPIVLPEKPAHYSKIANYGLPINKRKFPYYTKEFKSYVDTLYDDDIVDMPFALRERFLLAQKTFTKADFVAEEWNRRLNGFWFYNKDNLEYVTGYHYCILQYWLIPNDLKGGITTNPEFVDMIRDRHYAIKTLMDNPNYTGLAYIGGRRSSKTVDGVGTGFFDTTQRENGLFTIQSKSDTDGKKVFQKLVRSWKRVPEYFKPKDTGDKNPAKKIVFDTERTRSTSGEKKEYEDTLEASIEARSPVETEIDGERTTFQFHDEFGKGDGVDYYKRQEISKVCCMTSSGRVVGFAFWATTVEEMDKKGGASCKKIWDASDPNLLNDNGMTPSSMARLFFPAEYGMFDGVDKITKKPFVDEWGYSDLKLAGAHLDRMEKNLNDEQLFAQKRKFPRCVEDAFRANESTSPFMRTKLKAHKRYNEENRHKIIIRKGNFMWKDGIPMSEVVFVEDENGRWELVWIPPEDMRNKIVYDGMTGSYKPLYKTNISCLDPFAAGKVKDPSEGSKAASLVISRHSDFAIPTVVCKYNYRQDNPNKMYEDILMQSIFYSSPIMIERNKGAIEDWLNEKNYREFLMLDPFSKPEQDIRGIYTDNGNRFFTMLDYAMAYVAQHVGADRDGKFNIFPFNDLIDDMLDFDPSNRTKYDLTMAFLVGITAVHHVIKIKNEEDKGKKGSGFDSLSDWI